MEKNLVYYLGFSHFLGIGPMKFAVLLANFGNIRGAYTASQPDLEKVIGFALSDKFVRFRKEFDFEKKLKELKIKKIQIITRDNPKFPRSLLNISDPPICLYVRGNYDGFDFNESPQKQLYFAIVGTRKPTSYGQEITKKFATELAVNGVILVSGMAMGIDAIAHMSALDVNQKTIAILGCGVDIVYPPVNHKLYQRIIDNRGIVISEFPPGQTVRPGLFVARNRLISGLSDGVLVVEGAHDSGGLITARYAANQGKDVFAPPAPLTSPMAFAPNLLLKQGAKLVTTVEDILEEYNRKSISCDAGAVVDKLNKQEKIIFDCLLRETQTADDLAANTGLVINDLLNLLSLLELKGVINKNTEGRYYVRL